MKRIKPTYLYSLAGVGLVLVTCVVYLYGSVLRAPLLTPATNVKVDLPRTGGLYVGSGVSYRGIVVGKVTDIELTANGVRAAVRIAPGTHVPSRSRVQVRSLSPIGEQHLDFQPLTSASSFLRSGDVVTASAPDVPTTVADLAVSLDRLMGQMDPAKVHTVLRELSTGLGGAEEDLQRLIADSSSLIGTFDRNAGLLTRFASESHTLLQVGADSRDDLIAATSDLATFTTWLRAYQPELYRALGRGPEQISQLRKLVADLVDVMPSYLEAQGDLSSILNARNPQIRSFLQDFPAGVNLLAGAMSDGRLQIDQIMRRGPYCEYPTRPRDPRDTRYRPLQDKGHCSESLREYSQRGAQFAPGASR